MRHRQITTIGGRPHHHWGNGTTLPLLAGGDGLDDDDTAADEDDEADGDGDGDGDGDITWEDHADEDDDAEPGHKKTKKSDASLHREAAKYRTQRNTARGERDTERTAHAATKAELAELRASGDQVLVVENASLRKAVVAAHIAGAQDTAAVLPFVDMTKVTVAADGSVEGLDEQIDALRVSKPFLWKLDDGEVPPVGDDPFRTRTPARTGRPTNHAGKVKNGSARGNDAYLERKYGALRH